MFEFDGGNAGRSVKGGCFARSAGVGGVARPGAAVRGEGAVPRRHRIGFRSRDRPRGNRFMPCLNSTLIKLVSFKIRCLLSSPFTQLFIVPFDILLFVIRLSLD